MHTNNYSHIIGMLDLYIYKNIWIYIVLFVCIQMWGLTILKKLKYKKLCYLLYLLSFYLFCTIIICFKIKKLKMISSGCIAYKINMVTFVFRSCTILNNKLVLIL